MLNNAVDELDELESPLLSDDDANSSGGSSGQQGGCVMLHGEPVDLRHLFGGVSSNNNQSPNTDEIEATPASSASVPISSENEKVEIHGQNSCEPKNPHEHDDVIMGESSTFSLGEQTQSSCINRNNQSIVEKLMILPRKSRIYYLKAKMQLAHYIISSSRGSSTSPANSNTNSSYNSNRRKTRALQKQQKHNQLQTITQKSSLSISPSTPLLLKLLLPPLLLTNHILFYHAQTKPMWNLTYKTDIAISATASTLKTKATLDALNLPHHYDFVSKEEKVAETFTYMDAIRKLWKADGLGDAKTMSRVAAALLVVFSGIWPHLKLLLVHFCWFWPFCQRIWLDQGNNCCNNHDNDDDDDGNENANCDEFGEDEHEVIVGHNNNNGIRGKRQRLRDGMRKGCCSNRNYNNKSPLACCKSHNNANNNSTSLLTNCFCSNGHPHKTQTHRSPFLRTLSTLGKWSLADVLVVCILIAVLHLDWNVHPDEIRTGVENELPTLLDYVKEKYPDAVQDCAQLLGYTCGKHALVIHYPACLACQTAISTAYSHPGWATSEGKDIIEGVTLEGGGYAQLRVVGMIGTYYFCGAVVMSILVGLVVDWMDERDRGRVEERLLERKREKEEFVSNTNESGVGTHRPGGRESVEDEDGFGNELELREEGGSNLFSSSSPTPAMNATLSLDNADNASSSNQRPHHRTTSRNLHTPYNYGFQNTSAYTSFAPSRQPPLPSPTTNFALLKRVIQIIFSFASLPLVYFAITLPTMERLVYGGGPTLLHEVLGMVWTKEYNLISLVATTGDAGGWDTFLMSTFGMFVIIGPILRSVSLILHVLLGLPLALLGNCIERPRQRTTVRVALYKVTSILQRNVLRPLIDALGAFCAWEVLIVALIMIQLEMPSITDTIYQDDKCYEADPIHGRTCIEVQFNAMDNFLVVCVAWFVLVVASGLTMDLACSEEERDLTKEEKRYEFGMPIPQRRVWNVANNDDVGKVRSFEQEYSLLQHNNDNDEGDEDDVGRDGLEEIVFL